MASWAGAGFTTLYGLPVIRPFAREYVSEVFYADLLAGFSLFIAALILFFLASSIIASWIRNSRLNALDRSLGLLAGLVTSIVVLSLSVLCCFVEVLQVGCRSVMITECWSRARRA